jgi:hypothetical protein
MKRIRLISVTEKGWGEELPQNDKESLSYVADELLPEKGRECEYLFTGKHHPNLMPGEILIFRYKGKLLGEGRFLTWRRKNQRRMLYEAIRQYRTRPVADLKVGHNAYAFIEVPTLQKIRKAALKTDSGPYLETGERESRTKHRIGQGAIRKSALERYGKRCCLCQIDEPRLLIAGHIRGWAKGKESRSDPRNVVLMCAFHDSLFGKGFISLSPRTYALRISQQKLSVAAYKQIKKFRSKFRKPASHPPARKYLTWHVRNIFEKVGI